MWSGYLFDLTTERRLTERLDNLLVAKDRFLAIAGHELRTPVNNAILAFDNLLSTARVIASNPAARALRSSLESMSEMIGDLLDMSRADNSELKLTLSSANLRQVIESVEQSFSPGMDEKGLNFRTTVRSDVPDFVLTDVTRLRQILYNLLGNALKYTNVGSVNLVVSMVGSTDDNAQASPVGERVGYLSVEVEDTGLGIPPDKLTQVFEPFAMIGPADRRSTGLGLAVVRRIVLAMGGKIELQSTEAVGSLFTVLLPLTIPAAASNQQAGDQAISSQADADKPLHHSLTRVQREPERLLLVDDDRLGRVMLGMLLNDAGFAVDECESGEAALQRLDQRAYAVIISDYRMPGMTGKDLFEHILRQAAATGRQRALFILMTAGTPDDIRDVVGGQYDSVLTKPVSPAQIISLLHSLEQTGSQTFKNTQGN